MARTDELLEELEAATFHGRSTRRATPLLILLDLLGVAVAFILAIQLRILAPYLRPFTQTFGQYLELWPFLLLWPVVIWREGLYRGLWIPGSEHLKRIVQATTVASMIVMAATFVTKTGPQYSRAVILGGWLLSMPLLAGTRFSLKGLLTRLGFAGPRAVLIGAGRTAERVLDALAKQRPPSLRPVAIFDDDSHHDSLRGIPITGTVAEAEDWARRHGVTTAVLAAPAVHLGGHRSLLEGAEGVFRRTIVIPELIGLSTAETTAHDFGGVLALEVKKNLTYPHNRITKRSLDLLLTLLFSPLALLLASVIAVAIALESGGSIFYGQERVGYQAERFVAWKFRTMIHNAERALETHLADNPDARVEWESRQKLTNDPRLTRVGKVLRRLSLDELPQMWNVLRGEMSLVGPRPIMPEQIDLYGPAINLYKQVRPGLTGLWQVSGRASTSFGERVELDQYYVRNWSVWLDLVIIARTFWAVLSGKGAY